MYPVDHIFVQTELKIVLSKPAYLTDKSSEHASFDSSSVQCSEIKFFKQILFPSTARKPLVPNRQDLE